MIILDLILAVGLASLSITFLIIFFKALIINKNGIVFLDVNNFNEGWIEVLVLIGLLTGATYKFKLIHDQLNEKKVK